MPFKSESQRRYFNANAEKLKAQGVNVHEWNEASKGLQLPEKKRPQGPKKRQGPYSKPGR